MGVDLAATSAPAVGGTHCKDCKSLREQIDSLQAELNKAKDQLAEYPCSAQRCQLMYERVKMEELVEWLFDQENLAFYPKLRKYAAAPLYQKINAARECDLISASEAESMHKKRK